MQSGETEVLLEIGQSYLLNKEYDKAIVKFSAALKINPHDPELYYYLGLAYEGGGRLKEALQMYEKAIALDHGFSNAEIRLSEIQNKLSQEKKPDKQK
ncbi:MAG: tetratricopeptide repeat protein [candidate division WOR-3 bacterium]